MMIDSIITWRHFEVEAVLGISEETVIGDQRCVPGRDLAHGHRKEGVSLRLTHVDATNFTTLLRAVENAKSSE